jgi:MFS family permease
MTQQPGVLSAREVLASPGVKPFMAASTVLYTGVLLQATALGKNVFDITRSELDIGWLGLAEFVPAALLVLVTGTVADRFNRRVVSMLAQAGEMLCSLLLMLYALTEPTSTLPIFAIVVLFGVCRGFLAPAMRPIAAMIAPDGGLPRVIALYGATWTGAAITGPALAGFLYSVHPAMAYGAAAFLIGIAISLMSRVKVTSTQEPGAPRPTLRDAIEGLVFIRRTPVLLAAISLDLFAVLAGGAVALLPVIAEEQLNVGDVAYGWLRAAGGIGAALTAILLSFRPVRSKVGRTLIVAVAVFGMSTLVLGVTTSYWIAFFAVMGANSADMISVFIRSSLVPLVTPDEKRGRVSAVENVFIGASNELGAFESGAVSSLVGTPATVIGGGVATIAVAGLWWVAFPSLRKVDTFDELEPSRD